jgi:hypothetical protein
LEASKATPSSGIVVPTEPLGNTFVPLVSWTTPPASERNHVYAWAFPDRIGLIDSIYQLQFGEGIPPFIPPNEKPFSKMHPSWNCKPPELAMKFAQVAEVHPDGTKVEKVNIFGTMTRHNFWEVKLIPPLTSNLAEGEFVPIPTLPEVVKDPTAAAPETVRLPAVAPPTTPRLPVALTLTTETFPVSVSVEAEMPPDTFRFPPDTSNFSDGERVPTPTSP